MTNSFQEFSAVPERLVEVNPANLLPVPIEVDQSEILNTSDIEKSTPLQKAKRGAQIAIAATEILPTNELIRASVFGASELISRNPVSAGVAIGLSTFVIEAAGGLSASSLFNTETSTKMFTWINDKAKKMGIPAEKNISDISKIGWTFLGGTVIGLSLEQRENTDRTLEQNRRYSFRTSAWLAGVTAVGGALAAEGVKAGINNTGTGAIIGGSLVAAGATYTGLKRRFNRSNREVRRIEAQQDVDPESGFVYKFTKKKKMLKKAAELEQQVWDEKNYGSLEEYEDQIAKSRTFTSFDKDRCVGLVRIFGGDPETPPPFVEELPFDSEERRSQIINDVKNGITEEVGTLAVSKEDRYGDVSMRLWRLAYRDAIARGVKSWGIIMETGRVRAMNKSFGFTFSRLGDPIDYQGGKCAAHIMDLDEVKTNLRENHPAIFEWFVNQPLDS